MTIIFAGPTSGKTTYQAAHPHAHDTDDALKANRELWAQRPWRRPNSVNIRWEAHVASVVNQALLSSQRGEVVLTNLVREDIFLEASLIVWRSDLREMASLMEGRVVQGYPPPPALEVLERWQDDVAALADRTQRTVHWLARGEFLSTLLDSGDGPTPLLDTRDLCPICGEYSVDGWACAACRDAYKGEH